MAAPRAVQFIALRNLSRGTHQIRSLHMTGPATYAAPMLAKEPSMAETRSPAATSVGQPATRNFNSTPTPRAAHNTSPIDLAYLPSIPALEDASAPTLQIRVPIIPTLSASQSSQARHLTAADDEPVMKPQISTMSADAVFAPLAENADDHAMHVDFHAAADRLASHLRKMRGPVEKQAGIARQIWSDMVDDIVGGLSKRQAGLAA